ncbi:hypothetical protein NQ317_003121 [Molorchus minor]|uniref:BRCT domain-containing protein n=1 Tax=Molorchus minor TaxID=1323400 RepID=A0ABQ9JLZ9_9CUCU|nr:hypothetical protein NQ317_003121 [Molorchus minor]
MVKKMKPMTEVQLNNNDEIYFGVIDSKYRLEQHRIVTTGTRLNSTQKIKLKADLASIGGQYIENWTPECTHLTVEEITLTVKILHAIVDEKPIVKPAFWTKYAENVAVNLPPPNIDKYNRPPIAEALLNNIEFKSNLSRKQLFKNKLFVFSGREE